jgi:outer membrane receptor for ferrienterochelin and colicins
MKKILFLILISSLHTFAQQKPIENSLEEVIIRPKKTTVDIKLDKKIYNVGQDLMVKGGTISDILNNIPSVTVDSEGLVSLRGNESVTILINGKQSTANNIADVLRQIPAESIEKVEIIANPSARYDAEGGGGIINIILKRGKTKGINGTVSANSGIPENTGLNANLNYKVNKINIFTTQGYSYRANIGNFFVENNYLKPQLNSPNFIRDERKGEKYNRTYNGNLGLEWSIKPKLVWTNTINYRRNTADAEDKVTFTNNFANDASRNNIKIRKQNEDSKQENVDFVTNLTQNFEKQGHKLSFDAQYSINNEFKDAIIRSTTTPINDFAVIKQDQSRILAQTDYVLPFKEGNQFEAGYRFENLKQFTDAQVLNGNVVNNYFSGQFEYNEKINAVYSQYGFKQNKFQFLFGFRVEDSNIQINQPNTNYATVKKYQNYFPSAFITYQINDKTSISANYSRRIQRPRDRALNPFNNYASDVNVFRGNLDINPSISDVVDLGLLTRWDTATFNASAYVNKTDAPISFYRRLSGELVNGVPLIIAGPINLDKQYRIGFDLSYNFGLAKWWKLNTNFNYFQIQTIGTNTFVNTKGESTTTDFGLTTPSWFTKINSKIVLPNKIDWQTNFNYTGSQETKTGKVYPSWGLNLGFSKDIMKDKATISANVNDLFSTQRRIFDSRIAGDFDSYANLQPRVRQITFSFTYRFNKQKNEREKPRPKPQENEGGGDF